MLRWLTAGESHGPALLAILEGLPAGVASRPPSIAAALARRRLGHGRGARMSFERDEVELLGGVRHGLTQGGPVALRIGNTEWPKWEQVMSPTRSTTDVLAGSRPQRPAHPAAAGARRPRRHAEVRLRRRPAGARAGQRARDRGPGRPRRGRPGVPARRRSTSGWSATSSRSAPALAPDGVCPDSPTTSRASTPTRCAASTRRASAAMVAEIDAAHRDGDTLGGVVEVLAYGLPPGLGSHVHWDRRLDSRLAGALMGIQAIKGVEVGDGFETARRRGSAGPRRDRARRRTDLDTVRTARAGGIEGGMSTGEPLRVRAAMKPISTVPRALDDRRRRRPASPPRHQPAQRRVRGPGRRHRRRGDGRPGAGRRSRWRSSAATRSPRRRATRGLPRAPHGPVMPPRVVLVGPPGSGKSTVARLVAERLGQPCPGHRRRRGARGRRDDRRHLRRARRGRVPRAGARPRSRSRWPSTTGCSPSAAARSSTSVRAKAARPAPVVFLDVSITGAAPAIGFNRDRPLLLGNPRAQWVRLMAARRPVYEQVATVTVDTDGRTPDEVADEVSACSPAAWRHDATPDDPHHGRGAIAVRRGRRAGLLGTPSSPGCSAPASGRCGRARRGRCARPATGVEQARLVGRGLDAVLAEVPDGEAAKDP